MVTNLSTCVGHKDWARIHQRTFEKMESIDVYLKKRDERAQSVSALKVKEMTHRMRTALDSLKKLKTSPHAQTDKVRDRCVVDASSFMYWYTNF